MVNHYKIDEALINSSEARSLNVDAEKLQSMFEKPANFEFKAGSKAIHGPTELFEAVLSQGRKGATIQRYKGLGEMNPDQLWETTLDPEARNLSQVTVSHADDADNLFTTLMGEEVEPRRDFIQRHALNVEHLDV